MVYYDLEVVLVVVAYLATASLRWHYSLLCSLSPCFPASSQCFLSPCPPSRRSFLYLLPHHNSSSPLVRPIHTLSRRPFLHIFSSYSVSSGSESFSAPICDTRTTDSIVGLPYFSFDRGLPPFYLPQPTVSLTITGE